MIFLNNGSRNRCNKFLKGCVRHICILGEKQGGIGNKILAGGCIFCKHFQWFKNRILYILHSFCWNLHLRCLLPSIHLVKTNPIIFY